MAGKRIHVAKVLMAIGAHRLVPRNPSGSLLILNYHRLRPSASGASSRFDDGVFDTDFDTFVAQMRWLKDRTEVLDEEGLRNAIRAEGLVRGRIYSAVTFDDGYIDCLTLAKPVLDSLGIRGIFFIPFEMIDSRRLGWWDVAAYLLKGTSHLVIRVGGEEYQLGFNLPFALRKLLNRFKLEPADRTEALLSDLSAACGVCLPGIDEQGAQLMTWDQVKQLQLAGHGIGSHSMSHRALATLPVAVQKEEIFRSRRELASILGQQVTSFAYPVGGPAHFTDETVRLVREAGYEQAFTFNTGYSSLPVKDAFRIPRESASSLPVLKAKAWLPGVIKVREYRAG